MVLGVIAGVATAALGGISAASQARSQNRSNAQLAKYNKELWEFNWKQDNRNRDFQIAQNAAQRTNLANERAYTQGTQIRDFQYLQQQDTARYNSELAAYRKSDDIFQSQLQLNQASLGTALAQQNQFMAEQELNYTFRTADLGLQLQTALNNYTLSMFDESLSRQIADQNQARDTVFSAQSRDLAIGQANEDFGLVQGISNNRTAITKAQADADYGLTSGLSQSRTNLTKSQADADFNVTAGLSQTRTDLAKSQADASFGVTSGIAQQRAAIAKAQAAQDYALTIEASGLRKDLDINQAGESASLASKNAADRFGNQVKNIRGEQDNLRTATSRDQEMASIEKMQRQGAAKAGQAGRSTARLAQSMGFIAGMNQAALSDRILFGEQGASRQIADAGLSMQQAVDQSVLQARQSMQNASLNDAITRANAKSELNKANQNADFANLATQTEAGLQRDQTKQNADFSNYSTQLEAGLRRDQTKQNADFSNISTQLESKLARDKTYQSADFSNLQTQSEALQRRNQTVDSANLTDFQNRTDADLRRSQAYAASEMRIKRADNELATTQAGIDLGMSGALASLVSARINNEFTVSQINADRYQADLNAYANRMLEPTAPIERPAPLLLPEAIILDPPDLIKPPKPVAGSNISVAGAFLGGAASGIGSAIASIGQR